MAGARPLLSSSSGGNRDLDWLDFGHCLSFDNVFERNLAKAIMLLSCRQHGIWTIGGQIPIVGILESPSAEGGLT